MILPVCFTPILKPKPWGGESWTLVDLAQTSEGVAEHSLVARGPHRGETIRSMCERAPREILGDVPLARDGGFPLLCKVIQANSDLSLQVHPTVQYEKRNPSARHKHEAWYVVEAAENAGIYLGLKPGTTCEQLKASVQAGEATQFVEFRPVHVGELYYIPAGTCHALCGGVRVVEIQSPSDTTYRLYDWHRKPARQLHLDEALSCINFNEPWQPHRSAGVTRRGHGLIEEGLLSTPDFNLVLIELHGTAQFAGGLSVLIVLEGACTVQVDGGFEETLTPNEAMLCPAALKRLRIVGEAKFLQVRLG